MSTATSTLPPRILAAQSLDDMLQAAGMLRDWDSLEAIEPLVRLDRRAPGWVASAVAWVAYLAATLLALLGFVAVLGLLWAAVLVVGASVVNLVRPGWGYFTAVSLAGVTLLLLQRESRFAPGIAALPALAPGESARPHLLLLWPVRLLSRLAIALEVGLYLMPALLPLVLGAILFGLSLAAALGHPLQAASGLMARWPGVLSVLLGALLLLLGARRIAPATTGRLILVLLSLWGWLSLPWLAAPPSGRLGLGLIVVGNLIWFSGKAPSIVGWLAALLRHLSGRTQTFAKRIDLRLMLSRAARAQHERNRAAVGGDWRMAVCRRCAARLEPRAARLSYGRRLAYACCRLCHTDTACFTGIRSVEGWLTPAPAAQYQQVGDVLRVALAPYLDGRRDLPTALDMIVVAGAGDQLVEQFLIAYHERQPASDLPPLEYMCWRVEPQAPVSENTRRVLRANFGGTQL